MTKVVTRFAPSPTGFLHIGGLRTALFCWLYARRHGGKYVLRIEDTDLERSTPEAIQQILDGLEWAGLDHDEGPFYQTRRFDRYREVLEQLLAQGSAYRCYCTKEELEKMRADQAARGQKPRYDGRWRDRSDAREGVAPVVRFKNPLEGEVVVDDVVHGRVVFQNSELDDLICEHSLIYSRETIGFAEMSPEEREHFRPVRHPLVRFDPRTGRKSLFLASHAGAIVGWPVPEARAFLRELTEHATQRKFVYAHAWRQWDLVMWDNRVTMHRARPYDHTQVRDMHRTTVAGEQSTMEQAA